MNKEQHISSEQSRPTTSAGAWGLRHSGLVMGKGGRNEVKEFSGMWRLKPDAAPGGYRFILVKREIGSHFVFLSSSEDDYIQNSTINQSRRDCRRPG